MSARGPAPPAGAAPAPAQPRAEREVRQPAAVPAQAAARLGAAPEPGVYAAQLSRLAAAAPSRIGMLGRQLQRQYGNRYTAQAVALAREAGAAARQTSVVQAKLVVTPPGDRYEQEADRAAAQVVDRIHAPHETPIAPPDGATQPLVQRQSVDAAGGMSITHEVEAEIGHARGGGQRLPDTERAALEGAFGADFGAVRVHTGAAADQLNRSLEARAFTTGRDIFFRQGEYSPHSSSGRTLLAHELTHVVQQGGGARLGAAAPIQRTLYVGGVEYEKVGGGEVAITEANRARADRSTPGYRRIRGGERQRDFTTAWRAVKAAAPEIKAEFSAAEQRAIRYRLRKWISRPSRLSPSSPIDLLRIGVGGKSEDRRYQTWRDVADALIGEQRAKANKQRERSLAADVSKNEELQNDLTSTLQAVQQWITARLVGSDRNIWRKIEEYKPKFPWYPNGRVRQKMQNPDPQAVALNFVILHEVTFCLINEAEEIVNVWERQAASPKRGHINLPGEAPQTADIGAASFEKGGQHALIERNPFVRAARARKLPLGAGASNTIDALLIFAQICNLPANQKRAIAWAAFVFWNNPVGLPSKSAPGFRQISATRHTFHEIMDVATLRTGGEVEYDPDAADPYDVGYNRSAEPASTAYVSARMPGEAALSDARASTPDTAGYVSAQLPPMPPRADDANAPDATDTPDTTGYVSAQLPPMPSSADYANIPPDYANARGNAAAAPQNANPPVAQEQAANQPVAAQGPPVAQAPVYQIPPAPNTTLVEAAQQLASSGQHLGAAQYRYWAGQLLAAGDRIGAAVQFSRAFEAGYATEDAFRAAEAFAQGGDRERAVIWYRRVVTAGPGSDYAAMAGAFLAANGGAAQKYQTSGLHASRTDISATAPTYRHVYRGINDPRAGAQQIQQAQRSGQQIEEIGSADVFSVLFTGFASRPDFQPYVIGLLNARDEETIGAYTQQIRNTGVEVPVATLLSEYVAYQDNGYQFNDRTPAMKRIYESKVEYLNTSAQREAYKLNPTGDKIKKQNRNFDTAGSSTNFSGAGYEIFVMGGDGAIYAASHKVSQFHHSSFLAGAEVAASGEVAAADGTLTAITNKSGHYTQGALYLKQALAEFKDEFKQSLSQVALRYFGGDSAEVTWPGKAQAFYDDVQAKPEAFRPPGDSKDRRLADIKADLRDRHPEFW